MSAPTEHVQVLLQELVQLRTQVAEGNIDSANRSVLEARISQLHRTLRVLWHIEMLRGRRLGLADFARGISEIIAEKWIYRAAWIILLDARGEVTQVAHSGMGRHVHDLEKLLAAGCRTACMNELLSQTDTGKCQLRDSRHCDCEMKDAHEGRQVHCLALRTKDRDFGLLTASIDEEAGGLTDMDLFAKLADVITESLRSIELEEWRTAAAASVRENEALYRRINNNRPVMVHCLDTAGRIQQVNDFWLQQLGYERDEVIGRPYEDFLLSKPPCELRSLATTDEDGPRFCRDLPAKLRRADGSSLKIFQAVSSIRDKGGAHRHLLFINVNEADKSRHRATQLHLGRALDGSKDGIPGLSRPATASRGGVDPYRTLIGGFIGEMAGLVAFKDEQLRYQAVNEAFRRFLGLDESEILGKTDEELFSAESAESCRRGDRAVLADRARRVDILELSTLSGRAMIEVVRTAMQDSAGEALGILWVGQPVPAESEAVLAQQESDGSD